MTLRPMGPPLIDAHSHIFPTSEMGRRWLVSVGLDGHPRDGSIAEARSVYSGSAISQVVVLLYLRAPVFYGDLLEAGWSEGDARERVRGMITDLNTWGCAEARRDPRFIPFVGVDVRFMSEAQVIAEIDARARDGARGVKIVPPSMEMYADDPLLRPVYRRCAELGLPLLSQSGRGGTPSPVGDAYGRPDRFEPVLQEFPGLRLILAHMGRDHEHDVIALTARYPNVHTDTSHRLTHLGRAGEWTVDALVETIRRVGIDRVIFGTNYPITDPRRYSEVFGALPLTEGERSMIASENLRRLLPPA